MSLALVGTRSGILGTIQAPTYSQACRFSRVARLSPHLRSQGGSFAATKGLLPWIGPSWKKHGPAASARDK